MKKTDLSSSEYGTLWMVYQEKTMTQRMLEHFIQAAEVKEAKKLLEQTHKQVISIVNEVTRFFKENDAVVPVGYTAEDVNPVTPRLYGLHFDILCLRLLSEIGMGLHSLHLSMISRKDLMQFYQTLTDFTQNTYQACMVYLEKNNIPLRSPSISPSKTVEFAKGTGYMSGINPFNKKRALNAVEAGHIYFAIESNSLGMELITGFAQVANESEIKSYFERGKNLSKNIIGDMSEVLTQSDIKVPTTWAGSVTDSKVPPFSDKLMMYCTSLFCSFGLGSNAVGTAFSLRKDLPLKLITIAKDVLFYAQDGAKIMAKNGWLEEPPQFSDRHNLIH